MFFLREWVKMSEELFDCIMQKAREVMADLSDCCKNSSATKSMMDAVGMGVFSVVTIKTLSF